MWCWNYRCSAFIAASILLLLTGCGGGGNAGVSQSPGAEVHLNFAPQINSGWIEPAAKILSATTAWSELTLLLSVTDPNSPDTGDDGKPKPKAKHVRICLKHDPGSNNPLTASEAAGYLENPGGSTPDDIYVLVFDFGTNPQSVGIEDFKGAPFSRDERYWISAMLSVSEDASGPLSPASTPQRFKLLPGLALPPDIAIVKQFKGKVTGPDGSALEGAEVSYSHEGQLLEGDLTDVTGSYLFFVQVPNPLGASALRVASRGEVAGPTDYLLTAQYDGPPALERTEFLDPEFTGYDVNFILSEPPVAMLFATPDSGRASLQVDLDASASNDSDGSIVHFDYDWEGDGTYDLLDAAAQVQHMFFNAGTYSATVRVTDNAGLVDTASVTITVLPHSSRPSSWTIETAYTGGGPWNSIAMGSASDPWIVFPANDGTLRYSHKVDGSWNNAVITSGGGSWFGRNSCQIYQDGDGNDQLADSFYDGDYNGGLKYVSSEGGWVVQDADSSDWGCGYYNSLAFTPGGQPAIAYHHYTGPPHLIKYTVYDGVSWNSELVEGENCFGPVHLRFNHAGVPYIVYTYQVSAPTVKVAWKDGPSWNSSLVGSGAVGGGWIYYRIAFDAVDAPAVAYRDDNDDLRFSHWNGATWDHAIVGHTGTNASGIWLEYLADGNPVIAWYDSVNGVLNFSCDDGSGWQTDLLDGAGDVGAQCTMAVAPDGSLGIAYYDATNGVMKYAHGV